MTAAAFSEPLAFGLALADARRVVEAVPIADRARSFSAVVVMVVDGWSGRKHKLDIVDGLHDLGLAISLDVVTIQNAIAAAYRQQGAA